MLIASQAHLGTKLKDAKMQEYVWRRRLDGIHILDVSKTWEKIQLAARIIVTVENPADVIAISARPYAQRAVLKYAHYTGAASIAGRYTPGTFTNQITKQYREPRLLIVTDPRVDHQPIREASYANIPVIAFADSDSPLRHVDVAIPANNKVRTRVSCCQRTHCTHGADVAQLYIPSQVVVCCGFALSSFHLLVSLWFVTLQGRYSIGVLYYLLAREVLRLRGVVDRALPWEVPVDLFFYRDPEELKTLEDSEKAAAPAEAPVATYEAPEAAVGYTEQPTFETTGGWEGAATGGEGVAPTGWTGEAVAPVESWGAAATY